MCQFVKRRGDWSFFLKEFPLSYLHLPLSQHRLSQTLVRPDALPLSMTINIIINPVDDLLLYTPIPSPSSSNVRTSALSE